MVVSFPANARSHEGLQLGWACVQFFVAMLDSATVMEAAARRKVPIPYFTEDFLYMALVSPSNLKTTHTFTHTPSVSQSNS